MVSSIHIYSIGWSNLLTITVILTYYYNLNSLFDCQIKFITKDLLT